MRKMKDWDGEQWVFVIVFSLLIGPFIAAVLLVVFAAKPVLLLVPVIVFAMFKLLGRNNG